MSSITVNTPVKVNVPRVTGLAASLFVGLLNLFQRQGAERAARRARATKASEAAAVREYAERFLKHDPRFAADLQAAADRHEIGA